MTRLTLIATAAFLALSGVANAGEVVEFDRAQLDDPAYLEQVREKVTSAAHRECRSEHAGAWHFNRTIRVCVRDTVARAMTEIEQKKQSRVAEAAP